MFITQDEDILSFMIILGTGGDYFVLKTIPRASNLLACQGYTDWKRIVLGCIWNT